MEEIQPVVKEEVTAPEVREDLNPTPVAEVTEETPAPIQAGDKTDPNLLLKSLQEEREKRRLLEEELETLKSSALSEEVYSDEGKILKKQITTLTEKINFIEEEKILQGLYFQYPVLKDKSAEFDEFRKDYPRTKLENVAKLYLAENGLLEPVRKGLEKPTGGPRAPLTSGMTADDVKTLRETNFKKYQEMVSKGQIKIE